MLSEGGVDLYLTGHIHYVRRARGVPPPWVAGRASSALWQHAYHQLTYPSCASPCPPWQYARDLPEYPCAANGTGAVDFNASSPNRGNDTNPAVTYTNPAYMTTIVCAAPVRRQPPPVPCADCGSTAPCTHWHAGRPRGERPRTQPPCARPGLGRRAAQRDVLEQLRLRPPDRRQCDAPALAL